MIRPLWMCTLPMVVGFRIAQVYITPVICLLAREARHGRSSGVFQARCIKIWIYVQYRQFL